MGALSLCLQSCPQKFFAPHPSFFSQHPIALRPEQDPSPSTWHFRSFHTTIHETEQTMFCLLGTGWTEEASILHVTFGCGWVGGSGLDNVTDQIRPTHTHTHTLHQTRNPCLVDRQTADIYTLCQRLVPKLKWAHLNQIWQSDSSEKQTLNCAESVVAQRGNNHSCRIYITRQFLRL